MCVCVCVCLCVTLFVVTTIHIQQLYSIYSNHTIK